jgi:hypothetical protein
MRRGRMKEFKDESGATWTATFQERPGDDYKGRYVLVMTPDDADSESFPLEDVRWNSVKTAKRTLETMSEKELRRRLRIAVGRGRGRVAAP